MANPISVPGTVVPSGAAISPGGAQGVQGLQGVQGNPGLLPVGTVILYVTGGAPPATWMACDGSAISRTLYPDLYAAIGTTYGAGDGSTTFNLPDIRGRTVIGVGQGAGLTNRVLAATGGEEAHQLAIAELAAHTHIQDAHAHNVAVNLTAASGTAAYGPGTYPGAGAYAGTQSIAATNQNTGSGTAHNTMMPFLVLPFIIKVSVGGGATAQAPIADQTQSGLLRQVSGLATDYVGGDNQCHPLSGRAGFIAKTAAYSLTTTDSGKYVICSGGTWTLTLPAPASGLTYQVRNDMGISGTIGTITLSPTGGTIDGQASISLLPQQECTLITDGTNWRTLGLKREVILGTQDITTAQASAVVLLPVGYRYFELNFDNLGSSVLNDNLYCQLSFDGGATWSATNYFRSIIYNNTATTVVCSQLQNTTQWVLGGNIDPGYGSKVKVSLNPGAANRSAAYRADFGGWSNTTILESVYVTAGFYNASGLVNALKYYFASGNITQAFLTVKGVV